MAIGIVPAGIIEPGVLTTLREGIRDVFGKETVVLDATGPPAYAFDKDRGQYLAAAIIKKLSEEKACSEYELVLGVVDADLYAANAGFVFGEAAGKVAVVSITRLRESFYGLEEDRALFLKRTLTEAIHELGHCHGLGHCYTAPCAMFFSNSIVDTDRKGPSLCRMCAKRIAGLQAP